MKAEPRPRGQAEEVAPRRPRDRPPRVVTPWPSKSNARRLGSRYVLQTRIGRGATGEVWLASVLPGGEAVAVKLLRSELASDPELVVRFVRERTLLVGLQAPNLVHVRELVVENDELAIVMDLVEGGDLRQFLRAQGPLAPADALDLVVQLLRGLDVVHAAGIVHRDVKPENILLETGPDGRLAVRLTDFGIARVASQSSTRLTGLAGTPQYMAPEVVNGARGDARTDLYAAGVVLYELITGQTPFGRGHPVAVLLRHLDEPATQPRTCPDELWTVLESLLAKRADDRPASAHAAIASLEKIRAGLVGLPPAPTQIQRQRGPGIIERPGAAALSGTATAGHVWPHPTLHLRPERLTSSVRRPHNRARLVIGLAAVLAIVTGSLAVYVIIQRSGTPPATASTPMQISFAPSVLANRLVETRSWSYDHVSGDLQCTLRLVNPTSAAITADVDEVVAKSLATSTATIRFSPAPTSVVQSDPVVRYHVAALQPNASEVVNYDVDVAPGASEERLKQWQTDESTANTRYQPMLTIANLTLSPSNIGITVGDTAHVTLVGTMSDGSAAPDDVLAAVRLTSSNGDVASVAGRTITGIGPGAVSISAPAGITANALTVTVEPHVTTAPPPPSTSPAGPPSNRATPGPSRPTPARPTSGPTASPTATPTTQGPTTSPIAPTSSPTPRPVVHYSCPGQTIANVQWTPPSGGEFEQPFVAQGGFVTTGYAGVSMPQGQTLYAGIYTGAGLSGPIAVVPMQKGGTFTFNVGVVTGQKYWLGLSASSAFAAYFDPSSGGCLFGELDGFA